MRVVYLGDAISVHVQRWARCMHSKGWTVDVITYAPVDEWPWGHQYKLFHIPLAENFIEFANRRIRTNQIRNILDEIKPDLVHAHGLPKYGEYAYLSAYRPYILTYWGLLDLYYVVNFMMFFNKKLTGKRFILRKNTLHDACAITCLTEHAKKEMVRIFGVDNNKVHVFPWGVDINLFKRGHEDKVHDIRASLGIPEHAHVVLSCRMMDKYYNIDKIVIAASEVLKRRKDLYFVMLRAGGSERFEKYLKKLAKKLKIYDHFRFISQKIPHAEMPYYYNMADVTVMIPHTDQGPLSMHEAMACGSVVIATDIEGNREMIEDGKNGFLVKPTNTKEIAKKILKALDDDFKERAYRINIEWIKKNADWSKNAKIMERIYECCISG